MNDCKNFDYKLTTGPADSKTFLNDCLIKIIDMKYKRGLDKYDLVAPSKNSLKSQFYCSGIH